MKLSLFSPRSLVRLFLRAILLTCVPTLLPAGMVESVGQWKFTPKQGSGEGSYLIFRPKEPVKGALPLLIFLHGAGHRGYDLAKMKKAWIPKIIREGRDFDALVLCPQVDSYWSGQQATEFVQQALEKHQGEFDPDRVYLTGESAGGGGTWEGAKLVANKLAAAVPIASTLGVEKEAAALRDLPIWAFHNIHDPYQSVEKTRLQVAAVRAAGGTHIYLTVYEDTPGKKHGEIWPNTHEHAWKTAYQDPALWEWLFRQRRGQPDLADRPVPVPTLGTIVPHLSRD